MMNVPLSHVTLVYFHSISSVNISLHVNHYGFLDYGLTF